MKSLLFTVAAVALGLSLPRTAQAGDHGHHRNHHGGHHSSHHGGHRSSHHGTHYSSHHGHGSVHHGGYYYGRSHHDHHGFLGLGSLLGYATYATYRNYSPGYNYGYGRPAYRSAANALAAEVQIELARRGYYRGAIDGIIGSGTRRALRNFQIRAGLPVSGRIDRYTLDRLDLG